MHKQTSLRSVVVHTFKTVASIASLALASQINAQGTTGVGPNRTQTIELVAGWNAVYLEIQPLESEPAALFDGTPIEIAAAYYRPATSMEFIESPNDFLGDRKSWSVWYAPDRDDAALSNLYYIHAHSCYLIYAEEAYTWQVNGVEYFGSAAWHPNAFSLVGFPIEMTEQPTVANFFDGAVAQNPLKIYRMVNGNWSLITDPATTLVQPGKAYWIYSESASEFRGPLEVDFQGKAAGGLVFSEDTVVRELEIRNAATYPQNLEFSLQAGNTGQIPLEYVVKILDGPNQPIEETGIPMPGTMSVGPIEPGQAFKFVLRIDHTGVSNPLTSTNLTITSDAGSRVVVPILSVRRDLFPE